MMGPKKHRDATDSCGWCWGNVSPVPPQFFDYGAKNFKFKQK